MLTPCRGLHNAAALAVGFVCIALSANAVTIHRSFRDGYPTGFSSSHSSAVSSGGVSVKGGASTGSKRSSPGVKNVKPPNKLVGTAFRTEGGMTVCVQDGSGEHRVRMEKILVPQNDQPFAVQAAKFLDDLVLNKTVEVLWTKRNRSGEIVGTVYYRHPKGMVEVNLTMVKNGCAWHDAANDRTSVYREAEKESRRLKRGLWGGNNPVNPRKWQSNQAQPPKGAVPSKKGGVK